MTGWYQEFKKIASLAFPMVLSQVSQHLVQVIDSAMIGRVGVVPLAASAFASGVFVIPLVFCFGITVTTSILTSHAFGNNDEKGAHHVLRVSLLLAVTVGILFATTLTFAQGGLKFFGQSEEVVTASKTYFIMLVWSLVPVLIFSSVKQYAEAINRPWNPLLIILMMLIGNTALNYIFIFGKLGIPAMGLEGAGLATLLARIFTAVAAIYMVSSGKSWNFILLSKDWLKIRWKEINEFLSLGIPSAFQIVFEVSAFVFAAIMMGWISEETLASHQISISVAGMTFMVTLGFSFAATVRIGQYLGRQDIVGVRRVGRITWCLSTAFMTCSMIGIFLLREQIPTWFVDKPEVIKLTAQLLVVAALFQIFDGIQITMIAALRGTKDVRIPMFIVMFVYYGFCLPLAYILGFVVEWKGVGIWVALLAGLLLSSIVLSHRFFSRTKKMLLENEGKPEVSPTG